MNIELKIDDQTLQKLKSVAAEKNMSKQKYILDMLKKSLAIEDMNRIRKKLKGVAAKSGFKTEEDIFKAIS